MQRKEKRFDLASQPQVMSSLERTLQTINTSNKTAVKMMLQEVLEMLCVERWYHRKASKSGRLNSLLSVVVNAGADWSTCDPCGVVGAPGYWISIVVVSDTIVSVVMMCSCR